MTNQLTGLNSNPMHVLSGGVGDPLQQNSGSMSPTYQDIQMNQGMLNNDHRQKNSQSNGRNRRVAAAQTPIQPINTRPFQTIAGNAYAPAEFVNAQQAQKHLNQTIEPI